MCAQKAMAGHGAATLSADDGRSEAPLTVARHTGMGGASDKRTMDSAPQDRARVKMVVAEMVVDTVATATLGPGGGGGGGEGSVGP